MPNSVSHLAASSLLDKQDQQDWWHYPNTALFLLPRLCKYYSMRVIFSFTQVSLGSLSRIIDTSHNWLLVFNIYISALEKRVFLPLPSLTSIPCCLVLVHHSDSTYPQHQILNYSCVNPPQPVINVMYSFSSVGLLHFSAFS